MSIDRLSLVESTVQSQADFLDHLADVVRELYAAQSTVTRDKLEANLGPAIALREGALTGATTGRTQVANTLGNTEPYVGRVNMLNDPSFDRWPAFQALNILGGGGNVFLSPNWRTWYVLLSGTSPTSLAVSSSPRSATGTPLNSSRGRYTIQWGPNAGSIKITLWSGPVTTDTALPYMVGALRFSQPTITTLGDFTVTATVRVRDLATVITAVSETFDLKGLNLNETIRLHAHEAIQPGSYTRFVEAEIIITRIATVGGPASVIIDFGDPQLHASYTPDPLPFAPLLGGWNPNRLEGRQAVLEPVDAGGTAWSGWWRIRGQGPSGAPSTEAALAIQVEGETANRLELMGRAGSFNDTRIVLRGPGGANPNAGAELNYAQIEFRSMYAQDYPLGKIAAVQPTGTYVDSADLVLYTGTAGVFYERLRLHSFPGPLASVPDPFQAASYLVGGLQVLGARHTGWGAPTGTATRTTFATSTVTLPLLAERVKALLDDLALHGLIGP